ncbi:MAG: FTR1 family protein [Alphaproteobacteria bacterium]|nr:FTR1 family protein [Alphaproteobacteria bacterium]
MFQTATIVFREVLEIALVLSLILAATRGLPNRFTLTLAGLGLGIAGSAAIAVFIEQISSAIDGVGQEVFNAGVMFLAVGFLSWTVIWMKRHGRELGQHIRNVGRDVLEGRKPLYVIVSIVALSTLREGSEVVLFTNGMLASGNITLFAVIGGGLLGAAGGALAGAMLYFGILRAAQKHLFTVTNWLLIFLTAGIAAQGASFLIAAGILPELSAQVWDTSAFISGQGITGTVLKVLIGYTPRPTGMELVFYLTALIGVGAAYKAVGNAKPAPKAVPAATMAPAE